MGSYNWYIIPLVVVWGHIGGGWRREGDLCRMRKRRVMMNTVTGKKRKNRSNLQEVGNDSSLQQTHHHK